MNGIRGTALITGASSGIGYEITKQFAKNGHDVILVARNLKLIKELASQLKRDYSINAMVISKDLSDENSAELLYKEIKKKGLNVDFLINNAGYGGYGYFADTDMIFEKKMISLNVMTLTVLTKLFLKDMVKNKKGMILNVASTAAFQPGPLMSVYYASKAFILSFSEGIANELQGSGVSISILCPGPTETKFQSEAKMEKSRLFSFMKVMSAEKVAEIGYKGLITKKLIIIPGILNKILVHSIRFTPRFLVVKIVRLLQGQK